jgi:hypothetical protein
MLHRPINRHPNNRKQYIGAFDLYLAPSEGRRGIESTLAAHVGFQMTKQRSRARLADVEQVPSDGRFSRPEALIWCANAGALLRTAIAKDLSSSI